MLLSGIKSVTSREGKDEIAMGWIEKKIHSEEHSTYKMACITFHQVFYNVLEKVTLTELVSLCWFENQSHMSVIHFGVSEFS